LLFVVFVATAASSPIDDFGGEGSGDVDGLPFFSARPTLSTTTSGAPVRDVVDEFLSIVEGNEKNKENCTPGTKLNLGDGVVAQYGLRRFQQQAMTAVSRANLLTRMWKGAEPEVLDSEYFFYTSVRAMVEGDPNLFAAGNCYDEYEYKDYKLFCPYAYRLLNDSAQIMVKDLSVEYMYLGEENEFFLAPKKKAEQKLLRHYEENHGEAQYRTPLQ
jgi:G protein-coupled receptor 158